jgi:hypothetical protein
MRKKKPLFSAGLSLLFISLFPIISIENGVYYSIGDSGSFQRVASINPLIEGLIATIRSFFQDFSSPYDIDPFHHLDPLNDIKFYTLIQISLTLIIFPSILQKTKFVK